MPLPKLWTFFHCSVDRCLYIKSGDDVKRGYGAVLDIRCNKDKANCVKVKFSLLDKPKQLSLNAFSWDDNNLTLLFRGCGDGAGFLKVWGKHVKPYLNTASGTFSPTTLDASTLLSPGTSSAGQSTSQTSTLRKRPSITTPPNLMPATKTARLQQEKTAVLSDADSSTKEMDAEVAQHFLGFYMLPVSCLIEPPDELLVRKTSQGFIEGLKAEMMDNPTADVQPILALVRLKTGDVFDPKLKDGYVYETVGGNHSRQALQELLKENPELARQKVYSHRLCSVYTRMPTSLALRMASKHNRASTFTHDMTTNDKISQCRRLLYEMAGQAVDQEPPPKPPTWKKSCAAILSQTVDQLDDAMIFYLASLSCEAYSSLTIIYQKFADGVLKGQHIPRSKKGTLAKPPDLKGSKFKCLRGISEDVVCSLLREVAEGKISPAEMNSECVSIKQLHKVQSAFIKGTNSSSWAEAQEKYPKFATAEQLEPFKKLNFSTKLPEQFLKFCQRIMHTGGECDASNSSDTDSTFCTSANNSVGIFWKEDTMLIDPSKVQTLFQSTGNSFSGFPLSVFDVPNEVAWSGQVATQLLLLVRAVNYQVSLQDFTVCILCSLESLGDAASALKESGDAVEVGACVFPDKASESASTSSSSCHHDSACGLVVVRCGNPPTLDAQSSFVYPRDAFIINEHTKKPVCIAQKPVAFFQRLIQLFTMEGEWVMSGFSAIGSCIMAALLEHRNCLAIEKDPTLFINSKVRTVSFGNTIAAPGKETTARGKELEMAAGNELETAAPGMETAPTEESTDTA